MYLLFKAYIYFPISELDKGGTELTSDIMSAALLMAICLNSQVTLLLFKAL